MMGKSIIAVSDVHLGMIVGEDKPDSEKHRESQFMDFLDTLDFSKVSDFVLLGDILDFWRHDYLNVVVDESHCVDKLRELKNKHPETKFHYVAGNHDYHVIWLAERGTDYPFDIRKSVEIKSKDQVFYFTHGYELEVLSWKLYKSIPLYEEFSEDMCLVGEDGSRLADILWKHYFEKITSGMDKRISYTRELSTDKLGTRKAIETECLSESYEAIPDMAQKSTLEEIASKSEGLLVQIGSAQIESGEEVHKPEGEKEITFRGEISRGITDTIIDKIKEQVNDLKQKAGDIIEKVDNLDTQISPLDSPEKRIKPREATVKDLKKDMTDLSKLRKDLCSQLEKYFDLDSEVIKKMFPEKLLEDLKSFYKQVCDLAVSDYFTIGEIAESDSRHYMFGIKKDQYLIYGHTHEAYVDKAKKVANTGCWGIQNDSKNKNFLYVKIIDDNVTIMNFIDKYRGSEEWKP
jgi:UDP-2,3-diacylglucosamine pyrophosphatase LpxH